MPGQHRLVDLDGRSALPRAVVIRARPPSARPEALRVLGADTQRAVGVALAPAGVAEDVVRGVGAPLADREHDREFVVVWRSGASPQRGELRQQLRDLERDPLVGVDDVGEVVLVLVEREGDARAALEDGVEERVPVGVAGAADRVGIGHRAPLREAPQRGGAGEAVGQRRARASRRARRAARGERRVVAVAAISAAA